MKISALRLFNVKRFANRGVAIEGIDDGVNVLCAANEFGKSTSFEALHALFFQPYSGTPGDVKNLRPYSGGNPLVEADIATPTGNFRITKQYFGGKFARIVDLESGRLIAQADEAENFVAALVKGGAVGPAGLLWVRQGLTGVEKRSGREEENEKQVRASLLESVQGEVEAVTGGRRMAEIMAAVEEDLSALATPKGKPRERYAAAIEGRDKLDAERQKLWADLTRLREALDRRTSAMKRLAELDSPEDAQGRRAAIETAQAAFDAAKVQSEQLKRAEAELRLAHERRNSAAGHLQNFQAALQSSKELRQGIDDAQRLRSDAADKRHAASDAIDKARAEADAADDDERKLRERLARIEAALKAREDAERLIDLEQKLSNAESLRLQAEQCEAKFALATIPPAAVDELQALEVKIAELRAVDRMSRPTASVVYESAAIAPVLMDGTPMAPGEERSYVGQARLTAPGVGAIILRSNLPARANNSLEQALSKQRKLLDSIGVADLAAARDRQTAANEIEGRLRELRANLAHLAPDGLAALRSEYAARSATVANPLENDDDIDTVRAAVTDAASRCRSARQALREVEPLQRLADDAFIRAESALARLQAEKAQIDAILGAEPDREARERHMSEELRALQGKVADAQAQAEAVRASAIDLASAEAALKRARSVDQAAGQEVNKLREEIAGLNATISARCDEAVEEKWRETTEALSAAEIRVRQFAREAAALQTLQSALESARSQARELYLKPVMTELKPLLELLFEDVSITFDEKTLLPQTILRRGLEEQVDRLSGGMKEQLSVLTRLAFARLLAKDGRSTPVILDDALVYSDDDRIEKMFDALHRQSRDQQIIVFSCRQRAFQKLGGNVLEMTDWLPSQ